MNDKAVKCMEESMALLEEYGDRAYKLATDNPDWDRIGNALVGWDITRHLIPDEDKAANSLRCLTEVIYAMGYERGKRIGNMPNFVVAPEDGV